MTLLSHSLYAPDTNFFQIGDESLVEESEQLSGQFGIFDPCKSFITILTCLLAYPPCNDTTGKLLPICSAVCPEFDSNNERCGFDGTDGIFPAVAKFHGEFRCRIPETYIHFPVQYIETDPNNCVGFNCKYIMLHNYDVCIFSNPPKYVFTYIT